MASSKHFGLTLGYILLSTDLTSFVKGQGVVENVSFNPLSLVGEQSEKHMILKYNCELKSDKEPLMMMIMIVQDQNLENFQPRNCRHHLYCGSGMC